MSRTPIAALLTSVMLLSGLAACGSDSSTSPTTTTVAPVIDPGDGGVYEPRLDPADFVDVVDNEYFPLPVEFAR